MCADSAWCFVNNPVQDDYQRKLFLGGLSADYTEEALANFYRQFGEVSSVVIKRDPITQRSKGFGFVTYKDASSIQRAQTVRPHIIDGKPIDFKPALPRSECNKVGKHNSSERKIFIGGLKDEHDEEVLRDYFQKFGNVLSVNILVDRNTGRKRGFAFVEFDSSEGVNKAAILRSHVINDLSVEVKKSNYKHEQAKRMPYAASAQENLTPVAEHCGANSYSSPQYAYTPPPGYNFWGVPATVYPDQSQNGYGGYTTAAYPQNAAVPTWNAVSDPSAYALSASPAAAVPNTEYEQYKDYQQTYSGGPQKVGYLQTYRMNPYNT